MPVRGGPSAIYGFLYQILANLTWIAEIRFSNFLKGEDEVRSARLDLEPSGGGGDSRAYLGETRIVEQFKTRSGKNNTWSTTAIVDEVLVDLVKAVPNDISKDNSTYRFVTNGREGKLYEFKRLLAKIKAGCLEGDCSPDVLDTKNRRKFFHAKNQTEKEFFEEVVNILIQKAGRTAVNSQRVFHLLSRFEIKAFFDIDTVISNIDALLAAVVDREEEAQAKRRELCTSLLEYAAQNATIKVEEFFKDSGLDKKPLQDIGGLRICLEQVARAGAKNLGYEQLSDVRKPPQLERGKGITLFHGDSGAGKTWQLISLALNELEKGRNAVLISASGDFDADCQNISNAVYQDGYQKDATISLRRLAGKMREHVKTLPKQWLTACIDSVQDSSYADQLLRLEWEGWGINLAIATTPKIASVISAKYNDRIATKDVSPFSYAELTEMLKRRGLSWSEIPGDVKELLKLPVLAGIYCEVAEEGWHPTNEYELFEKFWKQVSLKPGQPEHPGDREVLLKLVDSILRNESILYPWIPDFYRSQGLNDEVLVRLERIGWLRCSPRGEVEVAHDRFLNWAVAERLLDLVSRKQISSPELVGIIQKILYSDDLFCGKRLGYVPMDYLWLACDPNNCASDSVRHLLGNCLNHERTHFDGSSLRSLLPTLGDRIVPHLTQYIKSADDSTIGDLGTRELLMAFGQYQPNISSDIAHFLIQSDSDERKQLGFELLKHFPNPNYLDELWGYHKESFRLWDLPEEKQPKGVYWLHDRTWQALRNAAKLNPKWVDQKLSNFSPENDPASELGWLIYNLKYSDGVRLWKKHNERLFAKVPDHKKRVLAQLVEKFNDIEKIPVLEKWVTSSKSVEFENAAAFSAISRVAPGRAIGLIQQVKRNDLEFSRTWWMPILFFNRPIEGRAALLERAKREQNGYFFLATVYSGQANFLDKGSLEFILNGLEAALENKLSAATSGHCQCLWICLCLFREMHKPELLEVIASWGGTKLDKMLADVAFELRKADQLISRESKDFIKRIGGTGVQQLSLKYLQSDGPGDWEAGANLTLFGSSRESLEFLEAKGLSPISSIDSVGRDHLVAVNILLQKGNKKAADSLINIVNLAEQEGNEQLLKDVIKIARYGNLRDFETALIGLTSKINEETELAVTLAETLAILGAKSEEYLAFVANILSSKSGNHDKARYLLYREGSSQSLRLLADHLKSIEPFHGQTIALAYCIALFRNQSFRDEVRPILEREAMAGKKCPLDSSEWLSILPELDIPDPYEQLLEAAFENMPFTSSTKTCAAIEGLFKLDPDKAFEAAEFHIKRGSAGHADLPKLLMRLAGDEAIDPLIDFAVRFEKTKILWTIARALRNADKTQLSSSIKKMINTDNQNIRQVAIEIIGWQMPGFFLDELKKIAGNDPNPELSMVAIQAIKRQESQAWVMALIQNIHECPKSQQWSHIVAISALGDPFLLKDGGDPLWEGKTLHGIPWHMSKYLISRYRDRESEVNKAADAADNKK